MSKCFNTDRQLSILSDGKNELYLSLKIFRLFTERLLCRLYNGTNEFYFYRLLTEKRLFSILTVRQKKRCELYFSLKKKCLSLHIYTVVKTVQRRKKYGVHFCSRKKGIILTKREKGNSFCFRTMAAMSERDKRALKRQRA